MFDIFELLTLHQLLKLHEEHPKLNNPRDLDQVELNGQFGGSTKSGIFVCQDD